MHATAACEHSGVVLLGRCCTSLDCCLFAPTVLATSRYGLLRAYTGEAGRLKRNCFERVGDSSRAGGDGGCVAGLSVVWCARSGCVRCALFPEGRYQTEGRFRSSSWADASCYETACLIQSSVNELAVCRTGPDRTAILGHGET